MGKTLIVGIAGGTGSGKTTFTQAVAQKLGEHATVISHDSYYRRHDDLTYKERSRLNYDHPDAYETDLMVHHLSDLLMGRSVQMPEYDFSIHNRIEHTTTVHPSPVILVEGIMILHSAELRGLMDIRVFVDADADVRILRRALRDQSERGRSLDSVITQYLATVKPMHEEFVEPTKQYAHIIVPGMGNSDVAVNMLVNYIQERLREEG